MEAHHLKNMEYYTNNGIPWITPKDLSKNRNIYISHGENDISELGLNKSSTKLLEKIRYYLVQERQ